MPFNPDVAGLIVAAIFALMAWSAAREKRLEDTRYWERDAERRQFLNRHHYDRFAGSFVGPVVTTTSSIGPVVTTTSSIWLGDYGR